MSGTTTQATGNGTTQHAPPRRGRSGGGKRHRRTKAELAAARAASGVVESKASGEHPEPIRIHRDAELETMRGIVANLDALPIEVRRRVAVWIDARYIKPLLAA